MRGKGLKGLPKLSNMESIENESESKALLDIYQAYKDNILNKNASPMEFAQFLALFIRGGYDISVIDNIIETSIYNKYQYTTEDYYDDYKFITNSILSVVDKGCSEIEKFLLEKFSMKKPQVNKLIVLSILTSNTDNVQFKLFETFQHFQEYIHYISPFYYPYSDPLMVVSDLNMFGFFERNGVKMMLRSSVIIK